MSRARRVQNVRPELRAQDHFRDFVVGYQQDQQQQQREQQQQQQSPTLKKIGQIKTNSHFMTFSTNISTVKWNLNSRHLN